MMRRLAVAAVLAIACVLPACSEDGDGASGPSPVGPPPASKQEAAQQLTQAGSALSAAMGEVQGGAKTKSAGLGTQANVSSNVNGSCAGGGTISAQVTVDTDVSGGGGAQQASSNVSYTLTASGCKTASGYTLDGGPLTMTVQSSSSTTTGDGGFSSAVQSTVTYSGSLTITGPVNAAVSYSNLKIVSEVAIAAGGGTSTGKVKVVMDGSASVNGSTFSFANETIEVNASR